MRGAKGVNCNTTREVVRETVGDERYAAFVSALPEPLKTLAVRRISPVEWVDYDSWFALEQRYFDDLFGGEYERYRELSRRICERDFNGVYRVLIKIGSPAYLVEKSAQTYSKFTTVGSMSCVRLAKVPTREAPSIVRLEGVPHKQAIISSVHGAIDALLHLTRAKNPACWIQAQGGTHDAYTVDYGVTY